MTKYQYVANKQHFYRIQRKGGNYIHREPYKPHKNLEKEHINFAILVV